MIPLPLPIKVLHPEAKTPKLGTSESAGLDLFLVEDAVINPGAANKVKTGLAFAIPNGFVGLIFPRSSAFLKDIDISGVIDADYRGEISIMFHNSSNAPLVLSKGKSYAQMLVVPYLKTDVRIVDSLDDTARGTGGFGSTNGK